MIEDEMPEELSADSEPKMYEASWQKQQIEQLFEDLQAGAEIQHVQVRTSDGGPQSDRAVSIQEAELLFRQGEAKAIQIRYRFENQNWCDTLMVHSDSVRIVRTEMQF